MSYILLMVLFWSPMNGVHTIDGFEQRLQPDMQTCLNRRDALQVYMNENPPPTFNKEGGVSYAFCVEVEERGYGEAQQVLKSKIQAHLGMVM